MRQIPRAPILKMTISANGNKLLPINIISSPSINNIYRITIIMETMPGRCLRDNRARTIATIIVYLRLFGH